MHPTGRPQLAHPGVDDRIAGLAALPCLQLSGIRGPREPLEIGSQRFRRRAGEVIENVVRELPPADLAEERLSILRRAIRKRLVDRSPDLAGTDLSELQMRREL